MVAIGQGMTIVVIPMYFWNKLKELTSSREQDFVSKNEDT